MKVPFLASRRVQMMGKGPAPDHRYLAVRRTLKEPCGRRSSFSAATRPSDGRHLVAVLSAQPVLPDRNTNSAHD